MAIAIPYVAFDGSASAAGPGIFDYLGRGKARIVPILWSSVSVSYVGGYDGGTIVDAYDGNDATAMLTNNTEVNSLVFDLGTAKRVVNWKGWGNQGYTDLPTLWYSDNGTDWTAATQTKMQQWTEYSCDVHTDDPGAHRYWRVTDQGAGGRFYINRMVLSEYIGDWADYAPLSNPHTGTGLVTATQSSTLGGSLHAYHAFDFRAGNDYRSHTNADNPSWWKADFGEGATVQLTHLGYRHPISRLYPLTYEIQGSNNDTDWTALASDTGNSQGYFNGAAGQYAPGVPVVGADAYRYIRLHVTAASGLTYLTSAEIEFYGTYDDGTGGGGGGAGGGIVGRGGRMRRRVGRNWAG